MKTVPSFFEMFTLVRISSLAIFVLAILFAIVPHGFSIPITSHITLSICNSVAHADGDDDDDDDDDGNSSSAAANTCTSPAVAPDGTTVCGCSAAVSSHSSSHDGNVGPPISPPYTPTPPIPIPTPNPSGAAIYAVPSEVTVGQSTTLTWSANNVFQCYISGPNFQDPYTYSGYAFSDWTSCEQGVASGITTGNYTTPGYYTYYYNYTLPNVGQASVTVKVDSGTVGPNCPTGSICTACLISDINGNCIECPGGYAQVNGACIFTDCSQGYSYQNGTCIRTSCTSIPVCSGNDIVDSCTGLPIGNPSTCDPPYSAGCLGGYCLPPAAPKVVSFSLAPSLVSSGKTTTITWGVENVTSCTVTGSNDPSDTWTQPSGTDSWTGSGVSSAITGQTIYTLHCAVISGAANSDGSPATWTDQTATVNIVPKFEEK